VPKADERQRDALLALVRARLAAGERVVAVIPFANTPKRPKGPEGKVREGLWQTARRYRPLLLTDRRLFVFDSRRTPYPHAVLAEIPAALVRVVSVDPGTLGRQVLVLDVAGEGRVPFELGRRDAEGLDALVGALQHEAEQ
jgi:hypothetical protein